LRAYRLRRWWLSIGLFLIAAHAAYGAQDELAGPSGPVAPPAVTAERGTAQSSDSRFVLQPGEDPENRLLIPFLKHVAGDQKQFWTSPARLKIQDLKWIVPFAGATGAFIAGDRWFARQIANDPSQLNRSLDISKYTTYSLMAASGGSFLLGHIRHDDHLQETGLLTGEAAINSAAVDYLLKAATQRQRPLEDSGNGDFFRGGASFPSEHAAIAWSIASVWAHEYPGPLSQFAAYGLASAVTVTRITSKEHFPSDVIVGSVLGWYFGRQAYRAHHDPAVGGSGWAELFGEKAAAETRNPENMGSPYVPLDSWVYPTLERLIAMGYGEGAYLDVRPWTRMQCAHLVEEAGDKLSNDDVPGEAARIYRELSVEFAPELQRLDGARNLGASVESVYTRVSNISGPPLRDGYHFGQTIVDDFGRPYGEGANVISGASATAVAGPLAIYVRGEYQYAPSVDPVPASTLHAMANSDFFAQYGNGFFPAGYSFYTGSYNRFRLLEGAASLTFHNIQVSFGKQSTWLGPGESGPLLSTDNAEPIPMLKVENVEPYHIPLLSRLLGPAHSEFYLGQLSGLQWVFQPPTLYGPNNFDPQPFIHGDKISFHPTPNFEFGMGLVAMFGGPGLPFTFDEFFRSYFSHRANLAQNPGKRFSAVDFSYRVPGVRNWLTVYLDSLVTDEYSPIGSTRASLNPGIYLPQIPRVPKLELRGEGLITSHPEEGPCCNPGYTYYDIRYISGYTNNGNLIGSWIGRAGWGEQGWATYNFSPRTMIQLGYRGQRVDREFLGGGGLNDITVRGNYTLGRDLTVSTSVQREHWNFPVLSPTPHTDVAATFQITYWPQWGRR